ncbi:MAG: hypothetical protein IJL02_05700 [Methanobrevibacter sp.]|uniref:glycosyltransferase family 39 protein n=1 Tax=Methanobrevibacter sp. TaxID=66852 RepID=UPI0025DFC571|nr:hypothetical protein [Methanobrevibacter sp.]MBQ6099342.1 hypothetical protein [Methanobrevibacter sp.]
MVSVNVKSIIGKSLFILSVLMLIYLLTSPITHLFTHIDEFFTTTYINFPVFDIITVTAHDVHPPLYYLIAKFILDYLNFFGLTNTLFNLKLVSIIPYALILIISFVKIRKDYGWLSAGLFSFAMFVMSDFFLYYLTARMYSWGTLFLLLSFIYFKDVINSFDKKSIVLFSFFSVCCVYTQYFIGISVLVLYLVFLVYILLFEEKDKLKYWMLSVILAGIMFVPWIPSLIAQMSNVSGGYWIPDVNLDLIISSFSSFVHSEIAMSLFSNNLIYHVFAIFILILLFIIYYRESIDFDDKTSFYIVSGFAVYIGTIVFSVVISILFKPILIVRYLIPVTAVLWLVISIVIVKIRNKKLLIFYSILVCILLIAGISDVVSNSGIYYDNGMVQQDVFDNIAQDNNSVVIATNAPMFLLFSDQWDIYCTGTWLHSLDMGEAHQIYDFNELDKKDTMGFINNNSDKTIYYCCWGNPELDGNVTAIPMLHNSHWNIYKVSSGPVTKSDYYKYDNGTIDDHNDIWTYLYNPNMTRNQEYSSITDTNSNGYIQIEIIDNYKIEFDMKQYGGKDKWDIVFYNSSSSIRGVSLANFNAQPENWYHVEIVITNGTINTTLNGVTNTQTLENPTHFLFSVNGDISEIQFKNFKAHPL